jgi:hypothetical protein
MQMHIVVNGQTYTSWESVPLEVKQQLAAKLPDANANGVPDLFEGGGLPAGATSVVSTSSFNVDGTNYSSVAALPAEIQSLLRSVLPGALGMGAAQAPQPPQAPLPPPPAGAVPPPAPAPTPAAPQAPAAPLAPTAPPAPAPPLAEGEVMLNGVPTRITGVTEQPKKKRWWRRD